VITWLRLPTKGFERRRKVKVIRGMENGGGNRNWRVSGIWSCKFYDPKTEPQSLVGLNRTGRE